MTYPIRMAPPLSPVLLAGLPLGLLPLGPLETALNFAAAALARRHPELFARLGGLDDPVFLIDPVDLPFAIELRPCPAAAGEAAHVPQVKVRSGAEARPATAVIRGPLALLLRLLQGKSDGDAEFFARGLRIEGDTAAVVALRNAVDGAEIDLIEDALTEICPLAPLARPVAGGAVGVYDAVASALEAVRAAAIAPAVQRLEAQEAALRNLDRRLAEAPPGAARVRR